MRLHKDLVHNPHANPEWDNTDEDDSQLDDSKLDDSQLNNSNASSIASSVASSVASAASAFGDTQKFLRLQGTAPNREALKPGQYVVSQEGQNLYVYCLFEEPDKMDKGFVGCRHVKVHKKNDKGILFNTPEVQDCSVSVEEIIWVLSLPEEEGRSKRKKLFFKYED